MLVFGKWQFLLSFMPASNVSLLLPTALVIASFTFLLALMMVYDARKAATSDGQREEEETESSRRSGPAKVIFVVFVFSSFTFSLGAWGYAFSVFNTAKTDVSS